MTVLELFFYRMCRTLFWLCFFVYCLQQKSLHSRELLKLFHATCIFFAYICLPCIFLRCLVASPLGELFLRDPPPPGRPGEGRPGKVPVGCALGVKRSPGGLQAHNHQHALKGIHPPLYLPIFHYRKFEFLAKIRHFEKKSVWNLCVLLAFLGDLSPKSPFGGGTSQSCRRG